MTSQLTTETIIDNFMKYIIQISLALIVALQLAEQMPGKALARDFPGADDIPDIPKNKTDKTD